MTRNAPTPKEFARTRIREATNEELEQLKLSREDFNTIVKDAAKEETQRRSSEDFWTKLAIWSVFVGLLLLAAVIALIPVMFAFVVVVKLYQAFQ